MKKALIFHQEDYSLTKLLGGGCSSCENIVYTKHDAKVATQHAKGFGIEEEDITYIEDMTITEINLIAN